mmetsp:Transcript_13002/g.30674  ORF Transcript_13002/g.30674 Transcript_13002/m.30674 type:complete len:244 (+) Transcript_13002:712-1443(+)
MRAVPSVTMEISVQFSLRFVHRVGVVPIDTVAHIVVSGMGHPVPHTDPAKLVPALPTRHLVTAVVLLDPSPAPRTRLGVGQDPVRRFGIVTAFFVPSGQVLAPYGGVGFFAAQHAEARAADMTVGSIPVLFHCHRTGSTCNPFAPPSWTPSGERVRLDEIAKLEALKLRKPFRCRLFHLDLRHDFPTRGFRAGQKDTGRTLLLDGIGAEIVPAVHAKLVSTGHCHLGTLFHFDVANGAESIVV